MRYVVIKIGWFKPTCGLRLQNTASYPYNVHIMEQYKCTHRSTRDEKRMIMQIVSSSYQASKWKGYA